MYGALNFQGIIKSELCQIFIALLKWNLGNSKLHKTLDLHNQNLKFMIIRENSRNNYYHKLEIMILHVRFKQMKII